MTASYDPLRTLFAETGYDLVEPPVLYDANIFVELAGEDLRRRLFLTMGADGAEMALRPDFTIPVCLHHLTTGGSKRRGDYAYLGPVFRQRQDERLEFLQAGVESLGRRDRHKADADILKLALSAVARLGVRRPSVRIGDAALFDALLKPLDLSPLWRKRLARTFGEADRLRAMIDQASTPARRPRGPSRHLGRSEARREAANLLAASGLATIGGRSADEIASRYVEKTALAAGIGARAAKRLTGFLEISGRPADALDAMRTFSRSHRLDIEKAIDAFEARLDAFADRHIDLDKLTFAAEFGRRLDYYTGFVFEMHSSKRRGAKPIVGGGRYDRLVALIGNGQTVPAVGFAMWLDRIGGAR
ncbi:MAG: ATP phosphoribosyltransferase regulatory subunit [Hyphomicrobiales bacterium]|nr:ATP phosphoribosyltransferase regulatory subunit [Hyphomicrobiales bacterium]